jgi:hypothetical protein
MTDDRWLPLVLYNTERKKNLGRAGKDFPGMLSMRELIHNRAEKRSHDALMLSTL